MEQRVVMITGANSGIGKDAALKFAMEGFTVVMGCRDLEYSRQVQEEIIAKSHHDRVTLMEVDLSSFESIRCFCEKFKGAFDRLDILIHNAAYFKHGAEHKLSPDNIEITFATNVFGPFLMTSLLLDVLRKSNDARILHAGSNIIKEFFDPKKEIEFDKLQGEIEDKKSYSVYKMYCQSKMALLMLTFKMAEEFKDDGIKVNALQINGAKMSKRTLKNIKHGWREIAYVQNLFFPEPSYMASKYFAICTSDDFKETTGKLFNDKLEVMQPAPAEYPGFVKNMKQVLGRDVYSSYAENKQVMEKVWNLSEELTESYRILKDKEPVG
ncbi:SDR family NAD(P)-dependent oxidoreductase [Salipaludibacillus daqingensis]|uniref:SDR family NAD(P)-dependent oxidoreductase n=1 Tax=Salipaludibacillus daqingensis TaxID=3041001 RepID=UPI0024763794|nr:SDR family NAD(P)-dependent oxidoreductase [Salipaludibacillus daqingensis]